MKASKVYVAIANGFLLHSNTVFAANSTASIKSETSTIAKTLMSLYTTNLTTIGVLPSPYTWSEAATLFTTMINYAFYTTDTTYSTTISIGLSSQIGPNSDFLPTSQSSSELNSDQALWALASLSAVETGFLNPDNGKVGWLGFAENVWTEQLGRWNASVSGGADDCGGGLTAGISSGGNGGSADGLSNALFFELGARLARYTGNVTFGNWAENVFSWSESEGLVDSDGAVFSSFTSSSGCSNVSVDKVQWSADAAGFLLGAAHLYNFTNASSTWETRLTNLLTETLKTFTPDGDGIIIEVSCERSLNCTIPQQSYKTQLASALLDTITVAPFTASIITPVLQASADAAVKSCSVGSSGGVCGTQWTWGKFDGLTGVGQDSAALVIMQGLLVNGTEGFETVAKGGATATSTGGSGGPSGTSTSSSASGTSTKKSGAERIMIGSSVLLGLVAMIFVGLL